MSGARLYDKGGRNLGGGGFDPGAVILPFVGEWLLILVGMGVVIWLVRRRK